MVNIEQVVNICTSREQDLVNGDIEISRILSRISPDDKLLFFSIYKVKIVLDSIKRELASRRNFEEFKRDYNSDKAIQDMNSGSIRIEPALGLLDGYEDKQNGLKSLEYQALIKACQWKQSVVLSVLVQLYALVEKDDKEILRVVAEYIWSYYNCISIFSITELDFRRAVYINNYYKDAIQYLHIK